MSTSLQDERLSYNALAIHFRGSYQELAKLIAAHSSWAEAYNSLRTKIKIDRETAGHELNERGIRIVLSADEEFPALLREIPFAPHALYVRGTLPKQETLCAAMVGTRKAGATGIQTAKTIAQQVAMRGVTIVSGLAFGIDAASHEGALEAGGNCVAVLASGVETITPRSNTKLGEKILKQGGAIISEYPVGTESFPHLFLERNRIVSGLSKAVIVIEAPRRSGTLCTARFAVEQNRELLVVPGSVTNPNFEGSHDLLKQGAQLITSGDDVLAALGIDTKEKTPATLPFLDDRQKKIVDYLTRAGEPVHTDALCEALGFSAAEMGESLAMLSILGVIQESNGKYYV